MNRISLPRRIIGCLLIGLSLFSVPRQVTAAPDERLDIVIVIDQSGSMGVEEFGQSDPLNLRWDAAGMLIDLLSPQDRVGVVPFSITADPVFPELMPLDSQERRELLRGKMDEARDSELGGKTAYLKALSATRQLLSEEGNQRAVIFLTDGLPNDATPNDIANNQDLQWFREQNIPVYFLWLKNNLPTRDQAKIEAVRASFEETGPPSVLIDSPTDIVYAFARVLTDLQPGTYLDRLDTPVLDQQGKLRFEARASADQLLSEATFILVSSQALGNFDATVTNHPPNAPPRKTSGRAHVVIRTVSSGTTPIDGGWSITTNARDTVAFAFFRSDLKLELVYPGDPGGGFWKDEHLLIGVRLSGVPAGQASLQASLIPGRCAARLGSQEKGQVYPLQPVGLSADNSIYWYLVQGAQVAEGRLGVYVQVGQLSQPLRLGQCFDAVVQTGVADALTVIKPSPSDPSIGGAIPVEVALDSDVAWESVTAYIKTPDDKVQAVSLPPSAPAGAMENVSQPGMHVVRVVAVGQHRGARVALLREASYDVPNDLVLLKKTFDLGEVRALGQTFAEVLTLSGTFISQTTLPSFGPAAVFDDSSKQVVDESLVQVTLCDRPEIVEKRIQCAVTVSPSNDLSPGNYIIRVPMQQSDPLKNLGEATLAFTRPESRLLLSAATIDLGVLEVTDRILTGTLQFQGYLWEGDPQLPSDPELLKLRRMKDQTDVNQSLVEMKMRPQIGGVELAYDLVLRPDNNLSPGKYQAEYAMAPSAANLIAEPNLLVVEFEMPAPGVYLKFEQLTSDLEAWGLLMWLPLPRDLLLPVIATTVHMTGAPALDLPEVARVTSSDEKTVFPGTVEPVEWREMGAVEGAPNQYRYLLVLRVIDSLAEGDKLVTLGMPSSIQSEREYTAPFTVLGGGRVWWAAGCPFVALMVAGFLAFSVRRARRNEFTGTLTNDTSSPKLALNLSDYRQYASIELTLENGKWGAKPSTDPRKILIRCIDRSIIEVCYRNLPRKRLVKGNKDGPWGYR